MTTSGFIGQPPTKRQRVTEPNREVWPCPPGHEAPPKARTKSDIVKELAESNQAARELPVLKKKAAQGDKLKEELEVWELPFRLKKECALLKGEDIVKQVKAEEESLQRFIRAECESPMWRSARCLIRIADLRSQLYDTATDVLRADFDAALAATHEDGEKGSLLRAKAIAAETVSEGKIRDLMEKMDPGWAPTRGLAEGPEADIAGIIMRLLWPRDYERPKMDSSK